MLLHPYWTRKTSHAEELATPQLIFIHEYEYLELAFISKREKA